MVVQDLIDKTFLNNLHTQRFTIVDSDSTTVPSPALNLTGLVIKWGMIPIDANGVFGTTPLTLDKSTATSGVTITDAANGICDVAILPADTVSLDAIEYYFELEVFDSGGLNGVVSATGIITLISNLVNA